MYKILSILLTLVLFAGSANAGDGWTNDFEAAKKQAAKENKDLLIDFTGSDWCGWCIKLHDEVFTKSHFKKEAPKKFVLVEIDFPKDKSKITNEIKKQNDKLAKEYNVRGYPTIILANADGSPYASTGYQEGGPNKYIDHLDGFYNNNAEFKKLIAQADKTKDKAEKAKLIHEAISALDEDVVAKYFSKYEDKIIELDSDNSLKLKNKYLLKRELPGLFKLQNEPDVFVTKADEIIKRLELDGEELQFMNDSKIEIQITPRIKELAGLQNEPAKILTGIDKIIKDLKLEGKFKQQMIAQKAMVNHYLQKDTTAAIKNIDLAIEVAPESPSVQMLKELKNEINAGNN